VFGGGGRHKVESGVSGVARHVLSERDATAREGPSRLRIPNGNVVTFHQHAAATTLYSICRLKARRAARTRPFGGYSGNEIVIKQGHDKCTRAAAKVMAMNVMKIGFV